MAVKMARFERVSQCARCRSDDHRAMLHAKR
jgi:hypothetical protein